MFIVDLDGSRYAAIHGIYSSHSARSPYSAILALHGGELGKSGMYVRRNWRTFSVSALAAFALSLLFARPILENQIFRNALATHSLATVWGA
jgi:hypothetical protein